MLSAPLRDSRDVASGTPWWKTTNTARQGFMLGAIYVFVGLGELVLLAVGLTNGYAAHAWLLVSVLYWLLAPVCLLLGIVYLTSALTLLRRERSGHGASSRQR